jgi:hypothetical protein
MGLLISPTSLFLLIIPSVCLPHNLAPSEPSTCFVHIIDQLLLKSYTYALSAASRFSISAPQTPSSVFPPRAKVEGFIQVIYACRRNGFAQFSAIWSRSRIQLLPHSAKVAGSLQLSFPHNMIWFWHKFVGCLSSICGQFRVNFYSVCCECIFCHTFDPRA